MELLPTTLTAAQRQAIQLLDGPLLVVAGPGAGKTETIVRRTAYLILERGVEPENLLVTTFTNKAAEELIDRLARFLEDRAQRVHVSTVHSFCRTLLERYPGQHPWGGAFDVLDERGQFLFVYSHMKDLGLSLFPKARLGDFLQGVLAFFNLCTEEQVPRERLADEVRNRGSELLGLKRPNDEATEEYLAVAEAYGRYRDLLLAEGVLDFATLQAAAYEMLRSRPEVRAQVADRYQRILVDEYQDTNRLQVELLRLVAAPRYNLCAVGDDDQSIYRFRGACVGSFLQFEKDFPGARRIDLDVNFRATAALVAASSSLIAQNSGGRREKTLSSGRTEPGVAPVLVHRDLVADEADAVVQVLHTWRDEGRVTSYDDVALQFRSVKYHAGPYLQAMDRHGVPYTVAADGGFFDREDILGIRDLFTFCGWKHKWDPRLLEGKLLELEPKSLDAVRRWAEDPAAWRAEETLEALGIASTEDRRRLKELGLLRHRTLAGDLEDLLELFYELLRASGYFERCCLGGPCGKGDAACESALLNLGQFSDLVARFQQRVRSAGTYRFREYLWALPERSLDALRPEHEGEAVRVMTVHQAKGLEFPVVAIGSAQEGRFPGRFRRASYPVPTELRLSGESDDATEHVRDQRRLFYVAMTRAQDLLIVGASNKVTKRGSGVSRFVQEIGVEHLSEPGGLAPPAPSATRRRSATAIRRRMAYSAMHSYLLCPLQYKLLHECGFASPGQHWFDLGLALHHALDLVHRRALEGDRVDAAQAEAVWRAVWRPARSWTAERAAQLDRTGLGYLRHYVVAHSERLGRVRFVEEPIELPVGEGLQLSCRLDLACRAEGGLEVVEFKVRTRKGLEDLHPAWQVEAYALALQQVRKEQVAKVAVHLLAETPGRDVESRAWDQTVAAQARGRLEAAAEGIEAGHFAPTPGSHCSFCDFRALCPESRARVPWTQEVDDDIPLGATP